MRIVRRVRADVGVLALLLAAAGCVDAFDGSNVQIDFASGVQTNARPGDTREPDQPPTATAGGFSLDGWACQRPASDTGQHDPVKRQPADARNGDV